MTIKSKLLDFFARRYIRRQTMNAAELVDGLLKVKVLERYRRVVGAILLAFAAALAGLPVTLGTSVPIVSEHKELLAGVGAYLTLVGWLFRNDPTKKQAPVK